jgi:hypothetical protein
MIIDEPDKCAFLSIISDNNRLNSSHDYSRKPASVSQKSQNSVISEPQDGVRALS